MKPAWEEGPMGALVALLVTKLTGDTPELGRRAESSPAVCLRASPDDQPKVATQMAAKWHAAASTVAEWKISWKPNHTGDGFGFLRA